MSGDGMGIETNLCGDGWNGMEVLLGWVGMKMKLDGDGYKICRDGWGSV